MNVADDAGWPTSDLPLPPDRIIPPSFPETHSFARADSDDGSPTRNPMWSQATVKKEEEDGFLRSLHPGGNIGKYFFCQKFISVYKSVGNLVPPNRSRSEFSIPIPLVQKLPTRWYSSSLTDVV